MPLKEPFKTSPHCLGARILHRAQFQDITAKLIPHGQGFAPLAPASPPAFEVNRPYLIDRLGASPIAQPPPFALAPRRALLRYASSFQHSLKSALASRFFMLAKVQFPNLARPPRHVRQL